MGPVWTMPSEDDVQIQSIGTSSCLNVHRTVAAILRARHFIVKYKISHVASWKKEKKRVRHEA